VTVIGKHLYADLYGIQYVPSEEELKVIVEEAAKRSKMTIVEMVSYTEGEETDELYGSSVIAIVVESHIAVHIWNHYRYATVDVYTCGEDSDPWKGFGYIIEVLKPEHIEAHYMDRRSDKKPCPFRKPVRRHRKHENTSN